MQIQSIRSVATTWPFVVSLFFLLLNDWYLKQAFPGMITGKLSDFAGIFFVAYTCFKLAPSQAKIISLAIGVGFLFWKGPYAQPLIDLINSNEYFRIGRVIDYTDLIALLILPFAWRFSLSQNLSLSGRHVRNALSVPLLVAGAVAIMGTSRVPYDGVYRIQKTPAEELDKSRAVAVILEVAKKHKMKCDTACPDMGICKEASFIGDLPFNFKYNFEESNTRVRLLFKNGKTLFGNKKETMQQLIMDIKAGLEKEVGSMEVITDIPRED